MTRFPLYFNHGGLVAGRGFIARVAFEGRCILEHTDDDFFCFFGINPGSAAGQGCTRSEASAAFRTGIKNALFEIAEEAGDFGAFVKAVERYVLETAELDESDWSEAVSRVRSGELDTTEFMTRKPAETKAQVSVTLVSTDAEGATPQPTIKIDPALNEVKETFDAVA